MTAPVLAGIGMGPGDPELVTVKAVRVLREADLVLVPVLATGEQGRAEATVRAHVTHGRVTRVPFAPTEGVGMAQREAAGGAPADTAGAAFPGGAPAVAFAPIRDPTLDPTLPYLAATDPP